MERAGRNEEREEVKRRMERGRENRGVEEESQRLLEKNVKEVKNFHRPNRNKNKVMIIQCAKGCILNFNFKFNSK